MKYFNRKPTKIINKPDLSKLDNLFAQIPSNFAPTPKTKVSPMKSTRPSTPMLDALVNTPKAAAKPGVHVSGSSVTPSAAPTTSTTASESRIAAAVLQMLQKSLGKPGQTGLAPLLTAAAARHDAAISAKLAEQAKGQKVVPNSHLTGLQRLIANANAKNAPSSTVPNSPVRI